jgi:DNA ligase-1
MSSEVQILESLATLVTALAATSSRKKKKQLLEEALQGKQALELLPYIDAVYDRYRQFYLTSDTVANSQVPAASSTPLPLLQCLHALEKRQLTGHAAIAAWKNTVRALPSSVRWVAERILSKDLQCHVGLSTMAPLVEKHTAFRIRDFSVALGETWDGERVWEFAGQTWYASRKLDGVRCVTVVEAGRVTCYSRDGIEFEVLDVVKRVVARAAKSGFDNFVLDGEIAIASKSGKDNFSGVMKQIRRKGHTIPNPRYHLFDFLPLREFQERQGSTRFQVRQAQLIQFCDHADPEGLVLQRVLQWKLEDESRFGELLARVRREGWEGLILRHANGYLGARSYDILKVKKMHDLEARVVAVTSAPQLTFEMDPVTFEKRSVQRVMLDAALIEFKGNRVGVGSGWSKKQRIRYHKHPEELIGQVLTVQYFEETVDSKTGLPSLRFPVCKWVHGESREV